MEKYFVTGIGTDVGKTVVSAILTEALQADYWKPIQAGDLDNSDSHKIENLISNKKSKIHPSIYNLNTPASPHYAAEVDGLKIEIDKIKLPHTDNKLIIEGAGGVLVPLNDQDFIVDLIKPDYKVIVVSRNYLGSINHTLLTLEVLINRGISVFGIIFNGEANPSTEQIILNKTGVSLLAKIPLMPIVNQKTVSESARYIQVDRF